MIISHKHKFIFFSNGKTGTTSIEKTLQIYNEDSYSLGAINGFGRKHIPPGIASSLIQDEIFKSYYKFVFVRNPWDWVISNWKYNFRKTNIPNIFLSEPKKIFKINEIRKNNKRSSKQPLEPEDIVLLYNHLKKYRAYPVRESKFQSDYVFDINNRPIVDFVGRYENLNSDFNHVLQTIGINARLPHENQTKRSHYRDYYNSNSRNTVSELWKRDIDNFEYEF